MLQDASSELSPVMIDGMKSFVDIMMSKHRAISRSLEEELSPMTENYQEELRSMQQDLRQMRREMKRMQKTNEMYTQTLEDVYIGSMQTVL